MDAATLKNYADRIESELLGNILPFWIKQVVDKPNGTFHGALTNDLVVDRAASRGALLSSRILWTYSAAYRTYRDPQHLEMANFAYRDLLDHFWDGEHGGFFWSIDAAGKPLNPRKQVYGQAFAIYALSEYYRASGLRESLDRAVEIFGLLERFARDRELGGYFEAFSREWGGIADMRLSEEDMNAPKSQNTHLHVMEAYTNLLRVWPDVALKSAQTELLDVMLNRILDEKTGHLRLFFSQDWQSQSDGLSYGHDIEAAWLLMEAAEVLGHSQLVKRLGPIVVKIADVTLVKGVDADGGVFNSGNPSGVTDYEKEWWPQAEAVVGFLCAYRISGDMRHLEAALRCWDFIEARLIDRKNGEWFRGVSREGAVLGRHQKVSFWKCPYHNGRACMEASLRLRDIALVMNFSP
ncbi:MAG: AGE family epimerase/isomerase [Nibricoccus sp.]